LTSGLILSLLLHEQTRCLITRETGDDWWRSSLLLLTIIVLLTGGALITGIGKADQVTTSVTSDGSIMSFQAFRSGDTTVIGRLFGSGRTSIDRETETGNRLSRLMAQSDGPLLIGEYASSEEEQKDHPIACVFGNDTETLAGSEIETSGILQHGTYSSLRTLQPFEGDTFANGTGIIGLRHRLTGNGTVEGRSVVTGNLSVSERIKAEQGESP
jgi:hypothetical protein